MYTTVFSAIMSLEINVKMLPRTFKGNLNSLIMLPLLKLFNYLYTISDSLNKLGKE